MVDGLEGGWLTPWILLPYLLCQCICVLRFLSQFKTSALSASITVYGLVVLSSKHFAYSFKQVRSQPGNCFTVRKCSIQFNDRSRHHIICALVDTVTHTVLSQLELVIDTLWYQVRLSEDFFETMCFSYSLLYIP